MTKKALMKLIESIPDGDWSIVDFKNQIIDLPPRAGEGGLVRHESGGCYELTIRRRIPTSEQM